MKNTEAILEPYFQQIEAGNPPSFDCLITKYMGLIADDLGSIEIACLSFLLGELYPAKYEQALNAKFKKMGLKFRVADMADLSA